MPYSDAVCLDLQQWRSEQDIPPVLTVAQVFTSAINLISVDNRLITLLPSNRLLVPFGIQHRRFSDCQAWSPGKTVRLEGWGIDISKLQPVNLKLPNYPHSSQAPRAVLQMLLGFLQTHDKENGIMEVLPSPIGRGKCDGGIQETMISFLDGFHKRCSYNTLTALLRPLIGYGSGLTPSADDFITGIIAALWFRQDPWRSQLAKAAREHLNRTTFVSAQMLTYAAQGRFSQLLLQLFAAIANGRITGQQLEPFLEYGHNSGHDTLCGIFVGLGQGTEFSPAN